MQPYDTQRSAFTIIETLMVISLVAVLSIGAVFSLRKAHDRVALKEAQATVLYSLETARSRAISGYGDTNHGVRMNTSQAIIFAGDSYVAGSGQEYYLPMTLAITPAGTDVVFTRLSGTADAAHVFTITSPVGETLEVAVSTNGTIEPN